MNPHATHEEACWIVREAGDGLWLAERTLRSLAERGIGARIVEATQLADAIDAARPAWLLRAGAMPERLPALPARAPGQPATTYLGIEVDDTGRPLADWLALVEAHGGSRMPGAAALPRWVVACVEAPESLRQALRHHPSVAQALGAAHASGRTVVASGIRARWSADVRVGLLIGTLHRGGAERVTLDLATRLPACGIATRLVTCFEPKRDALETPADAVQLHLQGGDLVERADRAFKRWGADVVHAHLVEARVLRRLTRLGHGVFTTAHNARAGWPSGHDTLALADVELALGCSLDVTRQLREAVDAASKGLAGLPVRTAWNGIAPLRAPVPGTRARVRRELGIAEDALVVISVANDRPQKRLHLLASILAALDRLSPGASAIQVGAGPDTRLPETLGTATPHVHADVPPPGRLHFIGASADVGTWLAAADVFVSTSAHEGLSLAQIEALAAGLPVVATAAGGHEELSRLSAACVTLPLEATAQAFAQAIVAAARSRRGAVVEPLSLRRMVERHALLYRAAVRARHARGDGVVVICNNANVGGAQSSARRFALALHAGGRRCAVALLFETDAALSAGGRVFVDAGVPLFTPALAQRANARTLSDAVVDFVRDVDLAVVIFWNANVEVKIRVADRLLGMRVFDVSPGEMYFAELARYFAKPASDLPYLQARDYGSLLAGVVVKFEAERTQATELLGRPVSVVPNGLPIPAAAQVNPGDRGAIIGTLARINPDKRLEELIAAFEIASARRPELELLIGGAPDKGHADYAAGLQHATAHLRIRWLGHVEAASLFARIALFVLVAEPAGCPNASLEAMAAGLAVLATDVGGMSEQVVDGATGWLTPRGDAAALAQGIGTALADAATLTRHGGLARRRAVDRFCVDTMVRGYLDATGLAANTP